MKRYRVIGIAAFVATILSSTVFFGAYHILGLRLNFTQSAPVGLWQVVSVEMVSRGDFVEVCPPTSPIVQRMLEQGYLNVGNCPDGAIPLLKPVAAVAGDVVTIDKNQSIRVNGVILPDTAAIVPEMAWPGGNYPVEIGEVWLLSTYNGSSLDSRYFGPVLTENIRGRAYPLWVQGRTQDMLIMEGN